MTYISGSEVEYYYKKDSPVIENCDFSIERGKMTAILGKNGCGKSTLVKLITALLPLTAGKITFDDIDISTVEGIGMVRTHCGIVFQNPDNQFVSPIIADDIAFGLSNHQIPESEYTERISEALKKVDLSGFEKRSFSTLSGGQKQRAALAGVLAINNDILIFDEASSMLDPAGKDDLRQLIEKLRDQNKTIIIISQNIADVINADRIILMADHNILMTGTAHDVLTNYEMLEHAGVQIPFPVLVYRDLLQKGIRMDRCPLTDKEFAEEICKLI